MTTQFKRGDQVAFQYQGSWHTNASVKDSYQNPPAIRVKWNELDYIVKPNEVRDQEEHRITCLRERYADVIEAWDKGAKKAKDMEEYGIKPGRFYRAKKKGLLK